MEEASMVRKQTHGLRVEDGICLFVHAMAHKEERKARMEKAVVDRIYEHTIN